MFTPPTAVDRNVRRFILDRGISYYIEILETSNHQD